LSSRIPSHCCNWVIPYYSISPTFTASHDFCLQSCDPSQRTLQDSTQKPSVDGSRMAWHWSPAKPWMAALRDPSVSGVSPRSILRTSLVVFAHILRCFANAYSPEPHILLFRRPLGTDPQSGRVDPELLAAARDEYKHQFGLRKNAVA